MPPVRVLHGVLRGWNFGDVAHRLKSLGPDDRGDAVLAVRNVERQACRGFLADVTSFALFNGW